MTYLLDDSGNEIVLNTEVTVTKQVLSFFDFRIKGNFSTNFTIPKTSTTKESLNYFGVNQSEKIAFSTQNWGLYKDGNLLTRGLLVIQRETKTELDCFFASGNASWINTLQGNIKELNWSDYDQDFTWANLSTLRTATTGMVFPLIDPGFNAMKRGNSFYVTPIYDVSNDPKVFVYDFYPSFYLKTILKEIAKQKQIKITGNIFEDPVFDKMVIPLPFIDRSLQEENYLTDTDTYASDQYISAGATETVTFGYESNEDSLTDLSTGRIVADGRSRNVRVRIAFDFNGPFSGEVYLRKNGVTVYTYTFAVNTFLRYQTVSLAPTDYLDVQVKNNGGSVQSITKKYFGYQLCGSWYESGLKILAQDVIPGTSNLEILTYIAQAFNCIVDFDDFSQTINFTKIDSVRRESATDLTNTVVDYEIEWQNGFSRQNYIRTNQTEDIDKFNRNELKFGELVFDGPSNGASQGDVFELKFGPSVVNAMEDKSTRLNLSYIPLYTLENDGEPLTYTTVTNDGGFPSFNGLSEELTDDTIIRIEDDNDLYSGVVPVYDSTATTARAYVSFIGTSTGKIYKQRINFTLHTGYRVLLNYPNYTLTNIGLTGIEDGAGNTFTTYPVAYYYIPNSDFTFSDELTLGAHPGPINNAVSIPLENQYYNRLKRIAQNPVIAITLRMSETLFNTISLSEFAYIDIGEWSGYFFIGKIENYKDSITDVRVESLKVD